MHCAVLLFFCLQSLLTKRVSGLKSNTIVSRHRGALVYEMSQANTVFNFAFVLRLIRARWHHYSGIVRGKTAQLWIKLRLIQIRLHNASFEVIQTHTLGPFDHVLLYESKHKTVRTAETVFGS